jgi:hypothetical protein
LSFNNANANFAGAFNSDGTELTNVNAATLGGLGAGNFWQTADNSGTVAGVNFIGTTDNQPLELKVKNVRALRLEPTINDLYHSNIVNVVGGSPVNCIASGVYGSVIGGGGALNYYDGPCSNSMAADLSFLGGGGYNSIQANAYFSVLGAAPTIPTSRMPSDPSLAAANSTVAPPRMRRFPAATITWPPLTTALPPGIAPRRITRARSSGPIPRTPMSFRHPATPPRRTAR